MCGAVLDILELSRLQSGRAEIRKTPVHAVGPLPLAVDRYRMLCGDLGIALDTSGLEPGRIPVPYTDADQMTALFSVLLDNAESDRAV